MGRECLETSHKQQREDKWEHDEKQHDKTQDKEVDVFSLEILYIAIKRPDEGGVAICVNDGCIGEANDDCSLELGH